MLSFLRAKMFGAAVAATTAMSGDTVEGHAKNTSAMYASSARQPLDPKSRKARAAKNRMQRQSRRKNRC